MNQVHHITHPLVQHKLTLMRKKDASTNTFRTLLNELSTLMAYEVTRDMPLHAVQIETPLEAMTSPMIDGKKLVFVPILRAGLGILDGMLKPGEGFEYTSGCRLRTPTGTMEGTYFFVKEDGASFEVPIPRFTLDATGQTGGRVLH